jgi:hypothetical protein
MKHTTRAMLAAFDAQKLEPAGIVLPRLRRVARPKRAPMSVQRALEWAFGVEQVHLDFGDVPEFHVGTDTIWRLMRQGQLGCRVEGGGRSSAHHDAEVIASFVAALPEGNGGRSMAVQMAQLARAGRVPDAMIGARQRCVPVAWAHGNQYGAMARTEVVEEVETVHRGRKIKRAVTACPVTYTPTARQIGAARRNWLGWWGAMLHVGHELRTLGGLDTIRITDKMPPLEPWRMEAAKKTD